MSDQSYWPMPRWAGRNTSPSIRAAGRDCAAAGPVGRIRTRILERVWEYLKGRATIYRSVMEGLGRPQASTLQQFLRSQHLHTRAEIQHIGFRGMGLWTGAGAGPGGGH